MVYGQTQIKKKTNHDVAYLIILLLLALGIFLFAIMFVNSQLPIFRQ